MFADLSIPHQVWVLVGLAFLVADLAAPGLILSCFGLGCLAGAAVAFLVPAASLALQSGAALAGTLFAFLAVRPPLRRAQKRRKERKAAARKAREQDQAEDLFAETPRPKAQPREAAMALEAPAEPAPRPRKSRPPEPRPEKAPEPLADEDPFAAEPSHHNDPFAGLSAPPTAKSPSAILDMFDEDDERSGFDLLEPVLDDSLRLSIDEEQSNPLLLTDTVEEPEKPVEPLADLDLNLSLDAKAPARPRNPVGRTATALTALGPFTPGRVELDGFHYKAFSDHNVKPGDKVAVTEQMPDHPEILVVEPRKGGL